MRVMFMGGTAYVGPVAVPMLAAAGHVVAIAHTGRHEHPAVADVEHLHGDRPDLLAQGGPVESWRPDAIVDTFGGGASADKAIALAACARRAGAGHIVAISSADVYQHCVEAGLGDGSGAIALPRQQLPIPESALLREGPYPSASPGHDNVAMERALHDAGAVTSLRPGTIYGPNRWSREWSIVRLVHAGVHRLLLPVAGTQLFHRVAIERVGHAIVAALEHPPTGFWACNVVDPYDWTYAGLAARVGDLLNWEWEPEVVPFEKGLHPWSLRHPVLCCDRRLREALCVNGPDPATALAEAVAWMWDHRDELAADSPFND